LVLPVVFIPVRMLHYFGIYVRSDSLLGRGVAAILSAVAFYFIGYRVGPRVFSAYGRLSRRTRILAMSSLAIIVLMVVIIGRTIRIH
jgi:hypothetical protein